VADHTNDAVTPATLSTMVAAAALGGDVTVLVAGQGCSGAADGAAAMDGVSAVLLADDAALAHDVAENVAGCVLAAQEAGGYSHIVFPATAAGKNTLPRVAAALDVSAITDVLSVESEDTFTRPMYAGNAIATVQSSDSVKVMSVRTTAFEKAGETGGTASVGAAPGSDFGACSTEWKADEIAVSDRPELASAGIVVAGGRALKSAEGFTDVIDPLADKLKAAVGASRAAVDAGYVPNDYQVGQTGKVVAPDLYIAAGISGAIQHLAGMKDSKTIVAVNKDPEAPIFQVADYGLVGDLFDVLPEITEKA
jgi:electron transfer flavoprotein alpha subunit